MFFVHLFIDKVHRSKLDTKKLRRSEEDLLKYLQTIVIINSRLILNDGEEEK